MSTSKKVTSKKAVKKAAPKKKVTTKKTAKKKAPTKKAAAKKAAKKKITQKERRELLKKQRISSIVAPDLGFNILDDGADTMDNVHEVMSSVAKRRKNQTINMTPASLISHNVLWIPEFQMQWMLGMVGIPHASMVELIGQEGVGKTTLIFKIAGWAMRAGCPFMYINCEGKQMLRGRIARALHHDKRVVAKMLDILRIERVSSLQHLDQFIRDFADAMRGRTSLKDHPVAIPHHIPIVIAADPWSRLMSREEAAKFYEWGKGDDKAKFKEVGTGSNLGHAKFSHPWCRRLAYQLERDNIILILGQHQTEDLKGAMDRASSYGPTLPQSYLELQNATHIGGRALPQLASTQIVHGFKGMAKFPNGNRSGQYINMSVKKNSYGPQARKMFMEIREEFPDETAAHFQEATRFDKSFSDWFCSEKFFGSKIEASKMHYTCESLGLDAVTAEEFHAAFHANAEARKDLGNRLGIEGYMDTVERIVASIEAEDAALETISALPSEAEVKEVIDKGETQPETAETPQPEDDEQTAPTD